MSSIKKKQAVDKENAVPQYFVKTSTKKKETPVTPVTQFQRYRGKNTSSLKNSIGAFSQLSSNHFTSQSTTGRESGLGPVSTPKATAQTTKPKVKNLMKP